MAVKTATIANSGTVSTAVGIEGYTRIALQVATMTGTAMTFQGAPNQNGPFVAIVDQTGAAISITIGDDEIIGLDAAFPELSAIQWLKCVSGSAEGAERTITLHLER